MCRVSNKQCEKSLAHSRKTKDLKILLNFKKVNNMAVENPDNFPNTNRILVVVRSGQVAIIYG